MSDSRTEQFDLVVIGGGSGGLAVAQRAAEYGASVAVIERGRLGGTCVNLGCVPKKIMWNAASSAHAIRDAPGHGFAVTGQTHDWAALKARRDTYVERLNGIYASNLESKGIAYISGHARFSDPHTLRVADRQLSGERIVIAVGGEPAVPDLPGASLGMTSDGFFELESLPTRVALIGTGYVSVELGGVLKALGSDVSIFARYDSLVRSFDEMLQRSIIEAMQKEGIGLHWHAIPKGIERADDGLLFETTDGQRYGPFDSIIWAIGRDPLTDNLGLDVPGVDRDGHGFIATDPFQTTSVPHIFAIGDVTGRDALTPVAIAAGRRLADRLWGGMADRRLEYESIPTVVFSHPPTGTCGLTEREARALHGDDFEVFTSEFVPMVSSFTTHRTKSRMKMITVGTERRIVGIHLFGHGSDEMLQGFAVAMRMGATKRDFDDTVAIHPTSAEELVTMR